MALTPWIRIGQPLEAVMSDYERIFDSWEQGGIRGLVFGRLLFADEQGQCTIPAFKERSSTLPKARPQSQTAQRAPATRQGKSTCTLCWPTPKNAVGL